MEVVSELKVSMRRLGAFLALPEPPAPYHYKYIDLKQHYINGGSSDVSISKEEKGIANGHSMSTSKSNGNVNGDVPPTATTNVAISMSDASFDWSDRSWARVQADGTFREASVRGGIGSTSYVTSLDSVSTSKKKGIGGSEGEREKKNNIKKHAAATESTSNGADKSHVVVLQIDEDNANEQRQQQEETATAAAENTKITLPSLSLSIQQGQLVGVVGPVGAGKSSLLQALLGELQPCYDSISSNNIDNNDATAEQRQQITTITTKTRPEIVVKGSVAYCSQVPWITASTVRENILFGQPFDPALYATVIKACALEEDLKHMPAGDETEIGERGISISGGQKARLALARAAYSRASIQLLDDPLSAVDPAVGRVLFDKCIGPQGVMQG